ncbi:hypothetical protein [Micromonospora saelicesensis]|uniref:hypothetical protein n=1 Tax=Micromonospora saelicesensis TaxID=285676 RepID=UPI000DC43036|nr:hypothetical protein [Micromonospora saelicesensis]RAO45024.1 hypothetical protein PSN01_05445 [Micromonospora saelicesensis]
MPTVVVLALTLALAPAPSPSATSNPLGDIVGGVGRIVDDLLGGDTPSAAPTPSDTPTGATTPSRPPVAGRPSPAEPIVIPEPARSAGGGVPAPAAPDRRTAGEGTGTHEVAVPPRDGDTPAPIAPPALANPTRNAWPPASYLLVVAVLGVLALLLLRRRAPVPAAAAPRPDPGPVPDSGPEPDPGPVPDNVSRLPTSLNAIYEMGRQDERLEQERRRQT